jgi:hypothetical protein
MKAIILSSVSKNFLNLERKSLLHNQNRFSSSKLKQIDINNKSKDNFQFNINLKSVQSNINSKYESVKTYSEQTFENIKGSVLEMMATRMSKKDSSLMMKYWIKENNVEKVNHINELDLTQQQSTAISSPPSIQLSASQILSAQLKQTQDKNINSPIHLLHPVFGRLVANLSYKQVYLTNVNSLIHAPVWEKQRILRPERALSICNAMISNKASPSSLKGVISMYHDKISGNFGIIDGQHRAGALMLLAQQGHWNDYERNILVDVFETENESQVIELFKEINASEPVRLVDMPGEVNVICSDVLDKSTQLMCELYPNMFKISPRCKSPHINIDTLRDDLHQQDFLSRHNIKNTEQLVKLLLHVNDTLIKNDKIGLNTLKKGAQNALIKARTNSFFLGLNKDWMNNQY